MENEWEREKQKILNSLRGLGQDTLDFQPESEVSRDTENHELHAGYGQDTLDFQP